MVNIAAKEMVPVVIAVTLWGAGWAENIILVRSDNMSVMIALVSGAARDPLLMHLLRCLHFLTACHQIGVQSRHIAGVLNTAADALSRDNLSTFYRCIPQADKTSSTVPVQLLGMLLHQRPDWTSYSWRRMFLSSWDRP